MLRLLWQEILFRRNAVIGWGLGLCFFPLVYMGVYPSMADEMQSLADLEIYQAMGVSLGTFEDFVASTVILFVPIVLACQIWTYHFFKGKVTEEEMVY